MCLMADAAHLYRSHKHHLPPLTPDGARWWMVIVMLPRRTALALEMMRKAEEGKKKTLSNLPAHLPL